MEIGHYTLLGQLPGGQYGAIWHARDDQTGREVALKQLALATPDRRPLLQQAAGAVAQVQHRNVAWSAPPVENVDGLWLVEEWLTGAAFETVLTAATLSRGQALGVVHRALEGLAELHRHRIVHGTVSPETIIVTTDGVPKLVDVAAFVGQPEAAGLSRYASPEAYAGRQLAPSADVFSAGALASAVLDRFGSLTGEVQEVLRRSTAEDPTQRQPDAAVLLSELDQAGDRTFGAGWWTTEGIAAVVASSTGATLATAGSATGAAGTGGAGAVSGSITVPGGGAVGGAKTAGGGAGRLGAKSGRGPLIAVGAGVVTLAVVAAGAYAITASKKGSTAIPATSTTAGGPGQSPSLPPPTPTPTPTPTPKPAAQGFTGTYTYEAVVTKTNWPGVKAGTKDKTTWTVQTTCSGTTCTSKITPKTGSAFLLDNRSGSWQTTRTNQAQCVDTRTQRPINQKVPIKFTRTLKVAERSGDLVTKIMGKARSAQTKKCRNQPTPLVYEDWKITITYVKS